MTQAEIDISGINIPYLGSTLILMLVSTVK